MESCLFYLTAGNLFLRKRKGICTWSPRRLEAKESLLRIVCFVVHLPGKVQNRSCHPSCWVPPFRGVTTTLIHYKAHPWGQENTGVTNLLWAAIKYSICATTHLCPVGAGEMTACGSQTVHNFALFFISSCPNRFRGSISGICFSTRKRIMIENNIDGTA